MQKAKPTATELTPEVIEQSTQKSGFISIYVVIYEMTKKLVGTNFKKEEVIFRPLLQRVLRHCSNGNRYSCKYIRLENHFQEGVGPTMNCEATH